MPGEDPTLARVKFLKDTVHPDHGSVQRGEVVYVDRAYVEDYRKFELAEETDEAPTRINAVIRNGKGLAQGRSRT